MCVLMGRAFAFVQSDLVDCDPTDSDSLQSRIYCCLGEAPAIENITLDPLPLPHCSLLVANSDRELYYEGDGAVHLFVYDPARAEKEITLELHFGLLKVRDLAVHLNEVGGGEVNLAGLPVGEYQVMSPSGQTMCRFQVAVYTLAALVAHMEEHRKENDGTHTVSLKLHSFGQPLQGGVWLTLRSAGTRQRRTYALVQDGLLQARLELQGEGPFYLDVQHGADTELTATVPLSGTRKAEREEVVLSSLGSMWKASLLPSTGTREIRGLHLREVGLQGSPFQLTRAGSHRFQVRACRPAGPVSVAVVNPTTREVTQYEWGLIEESDTFEFVVDSPLAVVAIGAFLDDTPWEGWALVVTPSEVAPSLEIPESMRAGEELELVLEIPQGYRAYVLVKDARLQCADRPATSLAARLQECARELSVQARTGEVYPSISSQDRAREVLEVERLTQEGVLALNQRERALRLLRWTERSLFHVLQEVLEVSVEEMYRRCFHWDAFGAGVWDFEAARLIPEHLARRYKVFPITSEGNFLSLAMVNPENVIAIDDVQLITGFTVTPCYCDEPTLSRMLNLAYGVTDLVEVEETVKDISAQDFGHFDFAESHDFALDRLATRNGAQDDAKLEKRESERLEVLHCGWLDGSGLRRLNLPTPQAPGEFLVEVFLAGPCDWSVLTKRVVSTKPLALRVDLPEFIHQGDRVHGKVSVVGGNAPYCLGVEVDGRRLFLPQVLGNKGPVYVPCLPGEYRITVEELGTGLQDTVVHKIGTAGRVSGLARTVHCLLQGDTVSIDDGEGIVSIQVLPNLRGPIQKLAVGTANYHHLCCEQTASKIMSACFAWLRATASEKSALEAIVAAGVAREKSMFLPGGGFALYPQDRHACPTWGPHAARYLCQLEALKGQEMSSTFATLIQEAVELGYRAAAAHGVNWPPTERRNAFECYWELKFGADDAELLHQLSEAPLYSAGGMVTQRSRESYLVAGLLRERLDLVRTLERANQVLKDVGPGGTLYSTHDSVAALALMTELEHFYGDAPSPVRYIGDPANPRGIEATEGNVLVEVVRKFEKDWSRLTSTVELSVGLSKAQLQAGKRVTLSLRLPKGYEDGDLVWICLPHALARLQGGGQVRCFSVDFEGRSSLDIELVATASTLGQQQTVLVCLRNMFEEERVGKVAPLKVKVDDAWGAPSIKLDLKPDLRVADLTRSALKSMPATIDQLQRLSLEIHRSDIKRLLDSILEHSLKVKATSVFLQWVEAGVASCRIKTESGSQEIARYPEAVHTRLVGRLQMLAGLIIGTDQVQEGELRVGDHQRNLSIMPAAHGPSAVITFRSRRRASLEPLQRLSEVQQALAADRAPEVGALQDMAWLPEVRELIGLLSRSPIPKEEALAVLARLAGSLGGG